MLKAHCTNFSHFADEQVFLAFIVNEKKLSVKIRYRYGKKMQNAKIFMFNINEKTSNKHVLTALSVDGIVQHLWL